jgi:hypothetical protein
MGMVQVPVLNLINQTGYSLQKNGSVFPFSYWEQNL